MIEDTGYPIGKKRYSISELHEKVKEAQADDFLRGYWEGVRDERLRHLRKFTKVK